MIRQQDPVRHPSRFGPLLIGMGLIVGLWLSRRYSYLLFHTLVEGFSIIVAVAIFVIVWNTWDLAEQSYLQFLGIAFLFVGGLDLVHTLAYKGMGVFPEYEADLPTQLWIATRYVQSLSLLIAAAFLQRRKPPRRLLVGLYVLLVIVLLTLIFTRRFPSCYVDGQGLTNFKIVSEYLISFILCLAVWRLYRQRHAFTVDVFPWLVASMVLTIVSELSFIFYASVYGFFNLTGHILKLFAFLCLYHAIVETGLRKPYALLFHNLQKQNEQLEAEITERKRAENALRESETRYRRLAESTEAVLWEYDILSDRWTYVAPQVTRMLGYPPEAWTDLQFWVDHLHPEDRKGAVPYCFECTQRGEPHTFEYRFLKKDGSAAWIRDVVSVEMREGKPVKLRGFMIDITGPKRAEQQIKHYAAELERSNEALEQFAYIVSHDLQEPVRTVKGYLELLAKRYQDQLDEKAERYLNYAWDSAAHMEKMIRALLDLSRVGTREKILTSTDIEEVLESALRSLRRVLEESKAEVTHDPLPTVMADKAQLVQVFQNLIANAVKFRREDRPPKVHVAATRTDERWRFSVTDNGIGIEPAQTDYIFQIFQRLHTEEEYPGLGIGLALCKRIVEGHGGRIWVESKPNHGSTFYFTLANPPPPTSPLSQASVHHISALGATE
ncbi:MAG: MASE3 domain-containing protein [Anaerolineae bacterium]